MKICPNCHHKNYDNTKFCTNCGTNLTNVTSISKRHVDNTSDIVFCANCGKANPSTSKFCKYCGAKLPSTQDLSSTAKRSVNPNVHKRHILYLVILSYLMPIIGFFVTVGILAFVCGKPNGTGIVRNAEYFKIKGTIEIIFDVIGAFMSCKTMKWYKVSSIISLIWNIFLILPPLASLIAFLLAR